MQPLVQMVRDLAVTGARTARVNYGARGWVAHHNTDLWRATAPIDGAQWGLWPTGGAWLCQHLWDAWDYGRDRAFLADIYPLMRGAAEFFLDTLVEDPETSACWSPSPSLSPENVHPFGASVCAGPAMDSQILRDLFAHCIEAAGILGKDAKFSAACAAARAELPPTASARRASCRNGSRTGTWRCPSPTTATSRISTRCIPAGRSACAAPRSWRPPHGARSKCAATLSTGWAIAWRINLWARLGDGEHAHSVIRLLLDPSRTYPNMFDAHPPFQIDGNFGGAAGIAEMLLQSVDGEIVLLPALPPAWATGAVRGLRARGGFEVDLEWRDGALTRAELRGAPGGVARVRLGEAVRTVRVARGRSAALTVANFR